MRHTGAVSGLLIGYARVSTDAQDLTAQREALAALGVSAKRIYVDHGLTGTNRDRPGLRQALAACRAGDTLVVTKLDRLAHSLPDARSIADELTAQSVKLNLGGSVHDPTDPVGRLLFNVLAMVAEFEADLSRMRTREGMKVAKAKGRLRGSSPSSALARRPTSSLSTKPASTPSASWRSCSPSPARPCTGPSPAGVHAPPLEAPTARRRCRRRPQEVTGRRPLGRRAGGAAAGCGRGLSRRSSGRPG